jgi:Leucine-rich repeat (LRR) protein
MTNTELKKNIDKIKELLSLPDYDKIDAGIELARALDEPAVFEALLDGCKMGPGIGGDGRYHPRIIINPDVWDIKYEFKGLRGDNVIEDYVIWGDYDSEGNKYVEYAILNIIALAPENSNIHSSIMRSNITNICSAGPFKNVDILANLTNLTTLNLGSCDSLQNVDGLANLTNLTSLDLRGSSSLQNVDGLANLTNLTSLDLRGSSSLQNVDGLANLPNLTSLDLSYCYKIQPKPSIEEMTTREEVAAYQEEIRKSMK